jgi:hypothetical protein
VRLAAALGALGLGVGITVTTLPRPPFPAPVGNVSSAQRLVLVSSTYRAPSDVGHAKVAAGAPRSFRGDPQVDSIAQGRTLFALYGRDAASARYLLALRDDRFRYSFDLESYSHPPRVAPGEREFVYEEIVWAREAGGVLYVENAHSTYARSSYGRNGYITAIDLGTKRPSWRSPALVANAGTFLVTDRYLVTGYGFTAEPDYLYLLDRRTGRAVDRLPLPSAPERITWRGKQIHVRTYDHDVVLRLSEA